MSTDIRTLEPKGVWNNFYDLCQIPHPSHHEEEIQKFVVNFGKSLNLETKIDDVGNILITKPATPGMEDRKGVILQAHLDMVPQKNSGIDHDFTKDPISTYIDGDWVTAKDTTLGADNCIGAAAAMTVLASNDLKHGQVECLFTSTEETGMCGASGLQKEWIDGDILLNLDTEDQDELCVGCAGGLDVNIEMEYEQVCIPADQTAFEIIIKGLKGGHSGMDIILGRGNANKILFRLISDIVDRLDLRIADVMGGGMRNAIPREAEATVVVAPDDVAELKDIVSDFEKQLKSELKAVEPSLEIKLEECNLPKSVLDENTQENLISGVIICPNGVIAMNTELVGTVDTSTNLASVNASNGVIKMACLLRSSTDQRKAFLGKRIETLFTNLGATVELTGSYPGWQPNMESPILKAMKEIHTSEWGVAPNVIVVHAGLECGLLGSKYPNWDMVSFGPTIRSPHSPDEKVNIASVAKFWKFLTLALENTPKK